jgi:ribosomal protein L25 (general stress protein Ctc)
MAVQTAQVSAKARNELGTRANRRLRESGLLPGVIYGHKEAVVPVTLPRKEVVDHLNHGAHLFDLSLDGKSEKVLIKEVQYDHLGIEVIAEGRSGRGRAATDYQRAGSRMPGDGDPRRDSL